MASFYIAELLHFNEYLIILLYEAINRGVI